METTTTEEVAFLAPLDHVSARARANIVFGLDYVWEVYKPEAQRKFGYYALPLLWGDRLVERFDSKLDPTTNTFVLLLTQAQARETLAGARLPGRERDAAEVRNYYRAREEAERLAQRDGPLAQDDVRRLHGLAMYGRPSPTPYRDEQNVIRDAATGDIVYLPPKAKDVPALLDGLVAWVNTHLDMGELPAPLVAALAHYQRTTSTPPSNPTTTATAAPPAC